MINIRATLAFLRELAKKAGKEIKAKKHILKQPHDKIVFLLAHRPDGALKGRTTLAKVLCILDSLVLKERDYLVIDYFGPEDANFPRALGFAANEKLIHIQTLNSSEHVLLTWRGYNYVKSKGIPRVEKLAELLQELLAFSQKADRNLVNTAYMFLFNITEDAWGRRNIPFEAFIKGDTIVYNSLAYNLYRYKKGSRFRRVANPAMRMKESLKVELDDVTLPRLSGHGLDGDDMKDGQSYAFPYLEAANMFLMVTSCLPTLEDVAGTAFSRTSYYEKLAGVKEFKVEERKEYAARKQAILKTCKVHLEILCERGLMEKKKGKNIKTYQPTARTYLVDGAAYNLANRRKAMFYWNKMKNYVEEYRRRLLQTHRQNAVFSQLLMDDYVYFR
ncbi:MAG: hypothetical protein ACTSXC_02250 [Candidatus Freyarchaeota archaeon]